MMRWFAALIGSGALIACGIVHGFWTDRWVPPVETAEAAARLDALPLELGDWDGQTLEVKPGEAGAGVAGCINRHYVHRKTGTVVSLFLVCGRPGPVSIHTPEVCYGASGFMVGAKGRIEMEEAGDNLWKADAVRTSATDEKHLRLYWAWNGGNGWTASARRPAGVRALSGAAQAVRGPRTERPERVQPERAVRGVPACAAAGAAEDLVRPRRLRSPLAA